MPNQLASINWLNMSFLLGLFPNQNDRKTVVLCSCTTCGEPDVVQRWTGCGANGEKKNGEMTYLQGPTICFSQ